MCSRADKDHTSLWVIQVILWRAQAEIIGGITWQVQMWLHQLKYFHFAGALRADSMWGCFQYKANPLSYTHSCPIVYLCPRRKYVSKTLCLSMTPPFALLPEQLCPISNPNTEARAVISIQLVLSTWTFTGVQSTDKGHNDSQYQRRRKQP